MEGYHFHFSPPPFLLHFFIVLLCLPLRTLGDDPCKNAICGEGTCVPSNSTLVGYDCTCYPGWSKFGIGFLACVVPNCSLNFSCGSPAPPSPPPPPPPPPPPSLIPPLLNLCNYVWCNEGTCILNGTLGLSYYCQCNEGSSNLLNLTTFPCFKKCSLGVDCNGVLLGPTPPPPPPNGTLESPPQSPPNGSDNMSKRWSSCMILLSTIILAWIMYE